MGSRRLRESADCAGAAALLLWAIDWHADRDFGRIRFGRDRMKAMILGFAAAAVIALGTAVALNAVGHSTAERFSSPAVRL